jgi:hypothetical protein
MDRSRHLLQQRKEGRLGIGNKTGSSLATPIVFLSNSVAQTLLVCFPLAVVCRDQLLSSQYNTVHLQGYTRTVPRERASSVHGLAMIEKCTSKNAV